MDRIHFCSAGAPLCKAPNALWCTILRDAVTCPTCVASLAERGVPQPAARGDAARLSPVDKLMP